MKYRLLTAVAGPDCEFKCGEIVEAGDANGPGIMERSMLEAFAKADGYVVEYTEVKDLKGKAKASTAVRSQAGVETADAPPTA